MSAGDVITGPPDFIGVGTQRAGTTWWCWLLEEHPATRLPRNEKREQHFFDQFGRQPMEKSDIKRYHELFARAPGELSGDWTPEYMRDFWSPRLVSKAAPEAKLLTLLRDPLERYRSGIVHTAHFYPETGPVLAACDAIERGRYALQLRRVYDYFDRDQLLVLQYEKCKADPFEQYRRTLEFIGAPPYSPANPRETYGTDTTQLKKPVWTDLQYAIVRELEEEVAALCELVPDLDVSLWPNFAHLANGRERVAPPDPPRMSISAGRKGPPDYVGVGTEDAGCDWWHTLLLEHDSIASASERSLDFFGTFCTRPMTEDDIAVYHSHFGRRGNEIVGEWTPEYMYEAWTPMLLHRAAPDAKLLVMLVNPVDHVAAALAPNGGARPKEGSLTNIFARGRYAPQLRRLLEYYGSEQILVLQLERCLVDPVGQYARTLRFLGIPDDFRPATLDRVAPPIERPDVDLWPDLEIPMLKELESDVLELRTTVPELDLALWPQFAHLARA